jgi:hypothetical protein
MTRFGEEKPGVIAGKEKIKDAAFVAFQVPFIQSPHHAIHSTIL